MIDSETDYYKTVNRLTVLWRERYGPVYGKEQTDIYVEAIELFILWASGRGFHLASFLTGDDYATQQRLLKSSPDDGVDKQT